METELTEKKGLSELQKFTIALLRIAIGWHFLYEGLTKLFTPEWTAAGYLEMSSGPFAKIFHAIAASPGMLQFVDFVNIWGLILIGIMLILGIYAKVAIYGGISLLALYYLANPPLVKNDFGPPPEGSYLIVNKNLIELLALAVLAILKAGKYYGLDAIRFTHKKIVQDLKEDKSSEYGPVKVPDPSMDRRELLKSLATVPFVGAFGFALFRKKKWESYEEQNLVDAVTGASVKTLDVKNLKDLKGEIPKGTIKGTEFSRLILGGNLLSGYSHSRDLIYVSSLVKAYHHRDKIYATLYLAEKCGVDTLLTNPILATLIKEYWERKIGKIKFISDCAGLVYDVNGASPMDPQEYFDKIQRAIDYGAIACYIQGETADYYMQHGKPDVLEKAFQIIRDNKIMLGIGSHHIETIQACVDAGYNPDFWMKTLHHHNYWSAGHETWHDNMYCFKPEETIAYMESLPQPWIAFKTMAAGAIHPRNAFKYAFENGADFVCAGMYDFQMVEDVNIAYDTLNGELNRKRDWRA